MHARVKIQHQCGTAVLMYSPAAHRMPGRFSILLKTLSHNAKGARYAMHVGQCAMLKLRVFAAFDTKPSSHFGVYASICMRAATGADFLVNPHWSNELPASGQSEASTL